MAISRQSMYWFFIWGRIDPQLCGSITKTVCLVPPAVCLEALQQRFRFGLKILLFKMSVMSCFSSCYELQWQNIWIVLLDTWINDRSISLSVQKYSPLCTNKTYYSLSKHKFSLIKALEFVDYSINWSVCLNMQTLSPYWLKKYI